MVMDIRRYKRRYWAVYSPSEELIAVCVYKKGAQNVVRLLTEKTASAQKPCPPPIPTRRCKRLLSLRGRKVATVASPRHCPPVYKRSAVIPKREEGNAP